MQFRDLVKQYEGLKPQIDVAVESVISNAHFISGPQVSELERTLAEYLGVKHCITCANGTDAISIAMRVWNVGKGDVVFVPDFTFFSSGECPADEGAAVVFVDVDEHNYNIDPVKLEEAILRVKKEGKYKAKAVVAVDLFGLPADYLAIRKICAKYNLFLLEDGAQGFGGNILGNMACSFGDISTTSFFPAKPLGCYGDGGAIFTNNDEWANLIRSVCVHGKDTSNLDDPNAKYNNIRLGRNSRLDTIQAAILLSKFDKFREYELDEINRIAFWYTEGLKNTDLILPTIPEGFFSSWAQYTVQLPSGVNRAVIQSELKEKGIPTMVYYAKPMHCQEAFKEMNSMVMDCHVTERLCDRVLSLPIDPYKTKQDIEFVINAMKSALERQHA